MESGAAYSRWALAAFLFLLDSPLLSGSSHLHEGLCFTDVRLYFSSGTEVLSALSGPVVTDTRGLENNK